MSLSPAKQRVIDLHVKPDENGNRLSIAKAMETVDKSRRTWYNWVANDPEFRQALYSAYESFISIRTREELLTRLHMPGFPLDALVRIYLADKTLMIKSKSEIEVKEPQTVLDLLKSLNPK